VWWDLDGAAPIRKPSLGRLWHVEC